MKSVSGEEKKTNKLKFPCVLFPQFYGLLFRASSFSLQLTEHGVKLLRVEVPLPPGCLVSFGLGVVGVVELWFRPK